MITIMSANKAMPIMHKAMSPKPKASLLTEPLLGRGLGNSLPTSSSAIM